MSNRPTRPPGQEPACWSWDSQQALYYGTHQAYEEMIINKLGHEPTGWEWLSASNQMKEEVEKNPALRVEHYERTLAAMERQDIPYFGKNKFDKAVVQEAALSLWFTYFVYND